MIIHSSKLFLEIYYMIAYDFYTLLMRKISFKTQLKIIFLIKLELYEAGEKIIFWTVVLSWNHYEKFAKKDLPNFTLVS